MAIQFARYLPRIGGRVVLCCARPLIPLLGQLHGVDVVAQDAAMPPYDCWIDDQSEFAAPCSAHAAGRG